MNTLMLPPLSWRVVLFWMLASLSAALPAQTTPAASTKAAMRQAIQEGQAQFWADPAVQAQVNEALGRPAQNRVQVKLRRIQQFNPECARLAMVFAEPTGQDLFEIKMNLCQDGSAPLEGANLAEPLPDATSTSIPRVNR
jgi:hypothetical protein